MKENREFDIVVWGATSFVGELVAEYLIARPGDFRLALGARNPEKLDGVMKSLGVELPTVLGDSFDHNFMDEMTARTKVVLSTVGPYQKYGEPLLAACAKNGTDYCDLTGEVPFIRKMMDKYHAEAVNSGARIVNCAGFDSLPSDLGVLYLNEFCQRELGAPVKTVEMQVRAVKGGISGGTIASAIETIERLKAEPGLNKILQNPYAVCPDGKRSGVRQPGLSGARKSEFNGHWLHAFVMGPVNTKIVHSSNARMGYPYGEDFEYSEWQLAPNALAAYLTSFSLGLLMLALYFPWTRRFLSRYLPAPGEGPTREQREKGRFELHFNGLTRNGAKALCRVTGDADPGYGSTAKQISEVALGLLGSEGAAGFSTPASSLGLKLVEPLIEHAGLTFEAWKA
ncbi:MAG: saccharopine dehydrogenase NADP-binding domain-containing protein [Candidatus Eremiobacteraeota bacterium]|nr:saccharopine dehydrogenase NADP-binding domain-containing protein [Candidatus Eremiobacteraeota bacterium]